MKQSLRVFFIIAVVVARTAQAYIGGEAPPATLRSILKINTIASCTFAKVSDRFLLSAAHCDRIFMIPNKFVNLLDTEDYFLEGHYLNTRAFEPLIHPLYQPPSAIATTDYHDLMLVEVEDASLFESVKISRRPITSEDELYVGGFGEKGNEYADQSGYTGAKKKIIGGDERHVIVGIIDADGKSLSMVGPGDSGSPVFRKNARGEFELVGVVGARTKSARSIVVDEVTGKIVSYDKTRPPYFWINRVTDSLEWLESILPADAFSSE